MSRHLMTTSHHLLIKSATDYHLLRVVAEEIISLMKGPVGMVCGPISTGGVGSIEGNMERFHLAVHSLHSLGQSIFDQTVFEQKIAELHSPGEDGYDWNILHDFYHPIFKSGVIHRKFFIPGWESSTGARWEREQAKELSIQVIDLADDFSPIW